MTDAAEAAIRHRAGERCEYCHLPSPFVAIPFECEHIIAVQHGGSDTVGNRAWVCLKCNRFKGPNLSGIDWQTSRIKLVRLFHPRRHRWDFHFRFDGSRNGGLTPIGRVTVHVLNLNDPLMVLLREELTQLPHFAQNGNNFCQVPRLKLLMAKESIAQMAM